MQISTRKRLLFPRRRLVGRGVLGIAALVLLLCFVLARPISRRYIFRGAQPTLLLGSSVKVPDEMSECTTTARDGVRVHMLALDAARRQPTAEQQQQQQQPLSPLTVVLFHNNRETAEEQAAIARQLARQGGLNALLVEYRGYGRSSNAGAAPTEDGLYFDAEAALEYLRTERKVSSDRIVLMGTSLGSGVAAEMAARGYGSRLILLTPYTSIPDLVTNAVPILPARLLLGDHFDTLSKASAIRIPTLIVHGDADEIVPFVMGEKLAGTIARARLLSVAGGHHGDLFLRRGDDLIDEIVSFILRS